MGEGHRKGKEENKMLTYNTKMSRVPLPPVITAKADSAEPCDVANAVVGIADAALLPPVQQVVPDETLPVLVLMTKDMKPSSLAIFQHYGKTLIWVEAMKNIPFSQLDPCVYLLVDYRLADARAQLAREDLTKWNVVHYVSWIQRVEEYLESIKGNVITSIPKQSISKTDFDSKLLNQPLVPPSLVKSILKRVMYCWNN